jgi:16S rRNA G966 N2-methylase RsmD
LNQAKNALSRASAPLQSRPQRASFNSLESWQGHTHFLSSVAGHFIDLFAGAGGVSEGFVRAGFKVRGAVEMDEMAARTYRLNHPGIPEDRVPLVCPRSQPH